MKMKRSCLLLNIIILFGVIQDSFEECQLQSIKGVPSYVCASVQELEAQGNRGLFNVVIHKYKTPPDTKRKPNLKIVLVEDGKDGISENTYKLLKDIHKLLVGNNGPITLAKGLLSNLLIEDLELRFNNIIDVAVGSFDNMGTLKNLAIVNNKMSEVKNGVFNNLALDTLSLSNNRISFIEKNAFADMTRLRRLHLDGNQLSEFQPEILMNNPQQLEELYLQNNGFTEIDRNTVRGLNNLKILNLQHNKIQQVASYTFDNLLNLEELYLSDNLIHELNAEALPRNGLQKLGKLTLNNNRISYLTTTLLERFRSLKYIRVVGNPWQCPCFDAILTWLEDHNIQQICDRDYYEGTRPICVVDENHPNTCNYNNKGTYYQKYNEINNKAPPSPPCEELD